MRTIGSIGSHVYKEYFRAGGGWCRIPTVLIMFLLAQAVASLGDIFVMEWYVLLSVVQTVIAVVWTNSQTTYKFCKLQSALQLVVSLLIL